MTLNISHFVSLIIININVLKDTIAFVSLISLISIYSKIKIRNIIQINIFKDNIED